MSATNSILFRNAARIAGCVFFLSLSGCATPVNQPAADDSVASEAKSGNIRDGMAHVYIYLGKLEGVLWNNPLGGTGNISINGLDVGGVNFNDCLYVELPPGIYNISWTQQADLNVAQTSPQFTYTLPKDSNIFLSLNVVQHTGTLFGVAGVLADPPTTDIEPRPNGLADIANMRIVVPAENVLAEIQAMGTKAPEIVPPVVPPAATDVQGVETSSEHVEEELSRLKDMYSKGLINKSEYDGKRKELLDSIN